MRYYIFLEDGKLNGCAECPQLTEGIENIEVSEDIYNNYMEDNLKYIYSDGKIIENPNYETEKQKQYINERVEEIKQELTDLDIKRIRAVCEADLKNERSGESWLDYYNSQIYDLRIELKSLEAQL